MLSSSVFFPFNFLARNERGYCAHHQQQDTEGYAAKNRIKHYFSPFLFIVKSTIPWTSRMGEVTNLASGGVRLVPPERLQTSPAVE
jgi:hypothetical protein